MHAIGWVVREATRLSVTDPWWSLWVLAAALVLGGGSLLALPHVRQRVQDARDQLRRMRDAVGAARRTPGLADDEQPRHGVLDASTVAARTVRTGHRAPR